jgi:hypothetical protein
LKTFKGDEVGIKVGNDLTFAKRRFIIDAPCNRVSYFLDPFRAGCVPPVAKNGATKDREVLDGKLLLGRVVYKMKEPGLQSVARASSPRTMMVDASRT